jgi:hypothetical protein
VGGDFGNVRVLGVFDAVDDFGFEGVAFFD